MGMEPVETVTRVLMYFVVGVVGDGMRRWIGIWMRVRKRPGLSWAVSWNFLVSIFQLHGI